MSQKRFSSQVVKGDSRSPARAMLRAVGFEDKDFTLPQVGIASTWSNLTPCNMHIDTLAKAVEKGIEKANAKALTFGTITVSDGISMGTAGMRYSLVSREVIADSIETVVGCQGFDGVIAIGGCDKNMPGCMMGMIRLNRPSIFIYGGAIMPGLSPKKDKLDVVSVFEAVGKRAKGTIDEATFLGVERNAIPGPGSCGGMYTANTMASAIEALGMSLPGSSAQLAVSDAKVEDCIRSGERIVKLIKDDCKPSDILSKKSFENAIRVVIALGGSTNAVLHLLAMARTASIPLSLEDFARLGKSTPVLADVKPSGKYFMSELIEIGGIVPLIKMLSEEGLFHTDCLTVTGKTWKENLQEVEHYPKNDIVRPFSNPIKADSHLVILRGNLAPQGAVAKLTGKEGEYFKGPARVFDGEEKAMEAILSDKVKAGDVVVIRYEGPKGGPGMREMLAPTSAIIGKGLGDKVALITDGRFSGGTHGFVVGHITPEAEMEGPLALIEEGDTITINASTHTIDVDADEKTLTERRKNLNKPERKLAPSSMLAKYASLSLSASEGALTMVGNG